ncbi:hypothetical protein Sjap_003463 [Stephania japonica]|uniref:Receptor-like serine/threonine-protein kinase n=1 Tax=Stephania japonica TaxID=461633 RepID=A0AAP0KNU6_9MAGN
MEALLLLLLLLSFDSLTLSRDTLTPNQPLLHNQTLLSPNQIFELGFFTPTNSNNTSWYLGIWFHKIPTRTLIWVANRDTPLDNSSSGLLTVNTNGDLSLFNQTHHAVWSSNGGSVSGRAHNPIVRLLDSGNLVVVESESDAPNGFIWQSYDYPSDTLLDGMKMGWDLKTGLNRKLTSWKSLSDPSMGDFVYELDRRGLPEMVMRNGSAKAFRTGPWNGVQFSGTPEVKNNSIFKPVFVSNDEELYFLSVSNDESVISRLYLNPLGEIRRLTWNERVSDWIVTINVQKDICNRYGLCGVYGICNVDEPVLCKCLHGFVPNSPDDWIRVDWSGGCRRRTGLDCHKGGDVFQRLSFVKVPDSTFSWVNESMSLGECQAKCLKNCSCTAYANFNISGSGSGCVLWFDGLIDLREFSAGGGQDLYVRLAAAELVGVQDPGSKKKKRPVAVIASVTVIIGTLLIGAILWHLIERTKSRQRGEEHLNREEDSATEAQGELELPLFEFVTVETATNKFSHGNIIGEGGFGPVYKGELPNGQEIAVKRLSKNSRQGLNEFKNEVIFISKLQHRNLVRLLGCCIQREEMMLIYEFMPNKSLDSFIFDQTRSNLLSWKKRFDIINGIALGLLYLHRDSRLRIIHRDLKAANVLLDMEMNPKISDFGLAKIFGGDETEANTRRVVGTYGYMSPEYAADGLFSMKSDVYSFGVMILEIVNGKRNKGFYHPGNDFNLLGHAWNLWNEDRALELVDEVVVMEDKLSRFEVLRCIHVGLLCVQQRPDDRPTMPSVVMMLGSDSTNLPQPRQPGFYYERSLWTKVHRQARSFLRK